jgi:hypothetical protein
MGFYYFLGNLHDLVLPCEEGIQNKPSCINRATVKLGDNDDDYYESMVITSKKSMHLSLKQQITT